ncbi:hypothetical protein NKI12_09985 [Mesorhizobium australicum]|uniref:Uncharacterized protein n=1 Tax=Mesorhizobium australicum TaxID=536018 RepID=A0ACC6SWP5_9HYPH
MSDDGAVYAVDMDFVYACRRAAGILKSKGSREARIKETADLVTILLSQERLIDIGERRYLAELLYGELDRPHARPGLTAEQKRERWDRAWMVRQYQQEQTAQGKKIGVVQAVQDLADKGRLPHDDVEAMINFMGRSRQPKS